MYVIYILFVPQIDNSIERTCDEIESTINQNVQNNLDKLEADCKAIAAAADKLLADDARAKVIAYICIYV